MGLTRSLTAGGGGGGDFLPLAGGTMEAGINFPSATGVYWPTVGSVAYIEAGDNYIAMGNVDSINMNSPVSAGYGINVGAVTETFANIGLVGTSHTLDISAQTILLVELTASTSCAFTMPDVVAGKSFTLFLHQAGGGAATFTDVKFAGGTAPTITATAGRMDILTFVCDENHWYGSIIQDFTP